MRKYRAFKCRIKIFKIVNYQAVISCRSALPLYKLGKNMSNEEVKLFGILITSVIAIIGGVVGWFGKIYLDSRIEKLKKSHALDIANIQGQISADIELQKTRLKNSEIFFQQQLTALKELNKLRQEIGHLYIKVPNATYDLKVA